MKTKKKISKTLIIAVIALILALGGSLIYEFSDGIHKSSKGITYREDGKRVKETFVNGMYFDENGYAVENGFVEYQGGKYLLVDYELQTGLVEYEGESYFFGETGRMQTGFIKHQSAPKTSEKSKDTASSYKEMYADIHTGALQRSFFEVGGILYHAGEDFVLSSGFFEENGKTYVADNGLVLTGLCNIGGDYYIFGDAGQMYTGLINYNQQYYFAGEDGKVVRGAFVEIDGVNSYFKDSGVMAVSEVVDVEGVLYYFDEDGKPGNTVTEVDGSLYCFENGVISSGWKTTDDGEMYFAEDGKAADGIVTIDGTEYAFRAGIQIKDEWYEGKYVDANGTFLKNVFDKEGYFFDDGTFIDLSTDGTAGRVFIVSGKYTSQLNTCDKSNEDKWQEITDNRDSSAYITDNVTPVIADHNQQGLECIKNAVVGETKLYILKNGQVEKTFICKLLDTGGRNEGDALKLSDGSVVFGEEAVEGYDLWTYTCNETAASVTIVGWVLANN